MKCPGELGAFIDGFLGSIPGALIVLDKEWRLVYLNGDALRFFTGDDASLIGRPLEEVYPRRFSHMLAPRTIQGLLGGTEKTIERYSNDLRKWFRISAYSSDSGVFIRLEDITREKVANRLRIMNQFSVDRAGDMVFWFKPSGHIIYANEAGSKSLKFEKKELTSMMVADIDPSFTDNKWTVFVNRLRTRESINYESSLQASDRSIILVEVTCNYLVYQGEEYLVASARDITERKRAEDALREAKMQVELYLDLMGHDINNLNQIALGYLELAIESIEDDKIKKLVMKPLDAIQNSSKLIENVRKLQRLKTGGLKIEAIDVGGLLAELRNQYLNMPGKDVVIDYSPLGDCHVMANGLLRDVFSNLIGNAIKHSGSSKSVRIGLGLERVGDDGRAYCRVIVEDDGPGIPDMQKEKVLERFRKEDTKASGKGLGLYLAKSLIDDFHGTIHVEDRIKGDHTKGARFVVMLPAVEK